MFDLLNIFAVEKVPDNANTRNATRSYRDLLPYAHCCPVSFSDFTKYSNVAELFTGYCQKRYNSVKKLPHMLKRAYILFYLAPENRNLKPFNKFKVSDDCPLNVKEKMLEIPTNLAKDSNFSPPETSPTTTPNPQTTEDREVANVFQESKQQKEKSVSQKPMIEILENRLLLSPIKLPFGQQSNKDR